MNQTLKTVLIIVVAVIILGLIFKAAGWYVADRTVLENDQSALNGTSTGSKSTSAGITTSSSISNSSAGSAGTKSAQAMTHAQLMALIDRSIIRVPGTGVDVSLSNGQASFTDGAVKGRITVEKILGKVLTDSGYDVFVDMTLSKEGQLAVVHYVALFRNLGQGVLYTSSVSIGDRLILNGIISAQPDKSVTVKVASSPMSSTIGYTITLSYLDRKNGESATTTPSLLKNMNLRVKNHIVAR